MDLSQLYRAPGATSRSPTPNRSQAIDVVRGAAILMVLGCHYVVPPASAGVLRPVADFWHRVGGAGVDLFFVLSGFLVSGLLFAEFKRRGRVDGVRFLVRRGFKIWPAYFCYIAFVAAWLGWGKGAGVWDSLWPNLLHVQNYFGTPRIHTWSLAVEEHFYLVGALLATWLLAPRARQLRPGLFPGLMLAGAGAVAAARYAGFVTEGRAGLNLLATHLRCDGLLIGSLLAYVHHFAPDRLASCRRHPGWCLAGGVALAAPTLWLTPDHSAIAASAGLTAMYFGFALAILGVIGLEEGGAAPRSRVGAGIFHWTARLGFFSYGIYLWHVDFAQTPFKKVATMALRTNLPDGLVWLGVTGAYVAAAVMAGALMSRAIEIPFLRLRERLFPSRGGGSPHPVASLPAVQAVSP